MHIAILTAGGAGMFCGTCMHDNTWAKSLMDLGVEVSLIPTYTPIRVDEENRSISKVYMGGINIYLDYQVPLWNKLPLWSKKWLDHPKVLNFVTRWGVSNDARKLGPLTLAMLAGDHGPNKKEIDELVHFLSYELKPDVVCFSNSMLSGILKPLKEKFSGKVVTLLQGEDIFLDDLIEPYQQQVIEQIQKLIRDFDACLVHSHYYQDYMRDYLKLDETTIHKLPLSIDLHGHDGMPKTEAGQPFTIGYLGRICEEKGLHNLVAAVSKLHEEHPDIRLEIAGYLEKRNRGYLEGVLKKYDPNSEFAKYEGSPATHEEKVEFLKKLDLFSLPTDYHEPKGISVIEAMANGIPVVQPAHGAFPEHIERTGGGVVYNPDDPRNLVQALKELYLDSEKRNQLAESAHKGVRDHYSLDVLASESIDFFNRLLAE